ncbi:MAG: bifunctional glutamate N-acetyltransferase/amino-acid acetyltransferase ArgJ [Thermodesulfobacteriota bacterium]|nr:bifunctional glutamate N-acetyltransferase/amino-acid acetyltransferase ArgJ [Thermodesulfobacteriota bacterium]
MYDTIQVPGFLGNGVASGIKNGGAMDLSLIFSEVPSRAVGLFTTNCLKAAPVVLDMERIKKGLAQAVIVNSGNANAATGTEGDKDAATMSRVVSEKLDIEDELVLVASTGIIGEKLPIEKIVRSIRPLVDGLNADGISSFAEGIITTDRFLKIEHQRCSIGGKEVTICGIAKGAGMIEPNMATMLSFIVTDADIDQACLDSVFRESANRSFNAITVDGCMSTNDTAVMLANGIAGNPLITQNSSNLVEFGEALFAVMDSLARSIVKDGEGATKLIKIIVEGASEVGDAKKIAYAIANSNLVKTAFFGEDPNWGRIISAAGSTGIPFSTDSLELYLEDLPLFIDGRGVSGKQTAAIMKRDNLRVLVRLGMGKESFSIYTSDLSHEYVDLNSLYSS